MALMFVSDRTAALHEMRRVAERHQFGLLVQQLDDSGVHAFLDIAARHAGPEALSLMSSYFVCGRLDRLTAPGGTASITITTSRIATSAYTPELGSVMETRRPEERVAAVIGLRRRSSCSTLPA